jgi:Metallo-peptidase family M12
MVKKFSTADLGSCAARYAKLVLLAVVLSGIELPTALAQGAKYGAKNEERSELILSNLPPKGSKAYRDLLRLAGKEAKGQVLGFTQSEMWSMPKSRIEGVIRGGATLGVKTTTLGPDWNHVLKAPSAPMPMTGAQEAMMNSMKASKETMGLGVMAAPDPAVVEYALMKDVETKSGAARSGSLPSRIVIPLNDKESITVQRTKVDMKENGCTWRGTIEGTGEQVMLMWWKGGRFSGMFTYRGNMYTLKNMGGEVHAVVETDPGKMPPDHGAMRSRGTQGNPADVKDDPLVSRGEGAMLRPDGTTNRRKNLKDRQDSSNSPPRPQTDGTQTAEAPLPRIEPISTSKRIALAERKVTIDVMVLYTKQVVSKYIDFEKDLIALAVEQGNESFANSGLRNIKLRLVHSQQVDYDESKGEHFDHLYRMVDGMPGFAKVRALRNEKRADVVALVVDDPSGCGLSTRVAADADEAFVVVHHACAALTYSLAHEIGHIIGARHDRALDRNTSPFPYGHGYVNGTKWRDIMSYKSSCNGCPRLPFWSNPTITIMGESGGTVDTDNARVILEQAERVSKFR